MRKPVTTITVFLPTTNLNYRRNTDFTTFNPGGMYDYHYALKGKVLTCWASRYIHRAVLHRSWINATVRTLFLIQLTLTGREAKKIRILIKKADILVKRNDLSHAWRTHEQQKYYFLIGSC